jgi:hypothetical protein
VNSVCPQKRVNSNPIEQRIELVRLERDVLGGVVLVTGHTKHAAIEAFVEDAEAAAVVEKHLDCVPASAEEDEHRAPARVTSDGLAHDAAEPFERASKIDGLACDEDLDADGNHENAPRASSTARRSAAANPGETTTRARPTTTSSATGGAIPRATFTRANTAARFVLASDVRSRRSQP